MGDIILSQIYSCLFDELEGSEYEDSIFPHVLESWTWSDICSQSQILGA